MHCVRELYAQGCYICGNILGHMKRLKVLFCEGGRVDSPNLDGLGSLKEVVSSANQGIVVAKHVQHTVK